MFKNTTLSQDIVSLTFLRSVQLLEPICLELGLSSVGLNVFTFNIPARRLYEALGYEATAITMRKTPRREGGV